MSVDPTATAASIMPERFNSTSAPQVGRLGLNLPERQNVDDVVRDLVSDYPGTIARADYPNPDYGVIRLNRFGVDWIVSVVRCST